MILGRGRSLVGRLVLYDALEMKFRELKLRKNPKCPLCGDQPTIKALIDYEQFCGVAPQPAAGATAPEESDEMTPKELKTVLDEGGKPIILDVREPQEYDICRLPDSVLIPLGQLGERMEELNPDDEIVVHCKMGGRSAKAVEQMLKAGFTNVKNLTGGIDRWSQEVDPSVPRY